MFAACLLLATIMTPLYSHYRAVQELRDQGAKLTIYPRTESLYQRLVRRWIGTDAIDRVLFIEHSKETNRSLSRLNPLRVFPSVFRLEIDELDSESLAPIKDCHQLMVLMILKSRIRTTTHLSRLNNLERLQLSQCPLEEIDAARGMLNLEILSVRNTNVMDLSPLENLPLMWSLNISSCPVHELAPLHTVESLRSLNAEKTDITDIEELGRCANLETLNISRTDVTSLTPLRHNSQLRWLNVKRCPLTAEQIDEFQRWHPQCEIIR